jgi:hypothetical protein
MHLQNRAERVPDRCKTWCYTSSSDDMFDVQPCRGGGEHVIAGTLHKDVTTSFKCTAVYVYIPILQFYITGSGASHPQPHLSPIAVTIHNQAHIASLQDTEQQIHLQPLTTTHAPARRSMSRSSPLKLTVVLVIAVAAACIMSVSSATPVGTDPDPAQRSSSVDSVRPSILEASMLSNQMRQAAPSRKSPETSVASSLFYDAQKKLWIYSYTSTAEFKQASGPDGYTSYSPSKVQPKGSNTSESSSVSFDKTRQVYIVSYTYTTELQTPP